MYRLLWDGTKWTPDTANDWGAGKVLRFTDGTGDPDAEGVTLVGRRSRQRRLCVDRAQQRGQRRSRPAVLRFDVSQPGTTLIARRTGT